MSVARITDRFAALEAQGRAAFVPYIVAGDPDGETAWRILEGLPGAGADLGHRTQRQDHRDQADAEPADHDRR